MASSEGTLSNKLTLEDLGSSLKGLRVLVRVDFNVPIHNGTVSDATRIKETIPTLKYILEQDPKAVILMSHCGRPDGRHQEQYSLKICGPVLEKLLNKKVQCLGDCVGPEVEAACANPQHGSVILLENLRFHLEEEGKGVDLTGAKRTATPSQTEKFRNSLTKLGDVFVNDAFGTAHRAHSSMVGVQLEKRAAGLLLQKELSFFSKILENPSKPFLAILGGAKVKDKIPVIKNLLDKVDAMIIGGGMAYTFKKIIHSMPIGSSLYDEEGATKIQEIMTKAASRNVKMLFPVDFNIANKFAEDAKTKIVSDDEGVPDGWQGLDCGPETIKQAKSLIMESKTIVWNGPQGRFEWSQFATGSLGFLDAVVEATKMGAISVVGGGDTASLVENAGKTVFISHVSTGGGASLELLEGKVLPGVKYLSTKQ